MCGGGRCAPGTKGAFLSSGLSVLWIFDNTTDCRVDAEWIIEKKDLRQQQQQKSMRQERTAASPASDSGGIPTDCSGSSPFGDHGLGGDGIDHVAANTKANTYRPEIDEMRCLLWAHGGSSVRFMASFLSHNSPTSPLLNPSTGGYFFGSVGQER